jgi:tetratricopeptide (TPR) repeat protein
MKLVKNKKLLIIKLFCLLLLIFLVSCEQNSELLFRRAEKYHKNNKYIEAVLAYTSVITGDNDSLRQKAYYRIALIHYLNLKNFQKAIEIFELYLKKYPDGQKADEILKSIGDIYTNNYKKHDYAIGEYQKLIDYYPDSPLVLEAIINMGKCYFKRNNYYQAIVEFKKAKKRFPESPLKPQIDLEIASSFHLLGETKKAIDIYKKIIKKSTKNPLVVVQAKYNLASIYEEKDELDKALKLYKTIQFTYPNPAVINLKIDRVNYRRSVQKR